MKNTCSLLAVPLLAIPMAVSAAIVQIPVPDAAYTNGTTKIDISGIPEFTQVSSITDGTQTVTFNSLMERRQVPFSWATWASPPATESATPPVLWSLGSQNLTLNLSQSAGIFGFELEPNPFNLETFEVTLVLTLGPEVVGVINETIHGFAGAKLIAAATSLPVDQVTVVGSSDFAIAQVRYSSLDYAKIDVKPGSYPNPINPKSRGKIPVAVLTTSTADGDPVDFDATMIDATTVEFGPNWISSAHSAGSHVEDVDGDGDLDMVFHFSTQESGIECGDVSVVLKGELTDGSPFAGVDSIVTVPCGAGNS